MTDVLSLESSTPSRFLTTVLLTSVASALRAFFGLMRMRKSLIAMALAQLAVIVLTTKVFQSLFRTFPGRLLGSFESRQEFSIHLGFYRPPVEFQPPGCFFVARGLCINQRAVSAQ